MTESTAISSLKYVGAGDERAADDNAVMVMQNALNSLEIGARLVSGLGDRDETDLLFSGQTLGPNQEPKLDVALAPLEGNEICAKGGYNAISAVAMAGSGGFLQVPRIYMEKIAVGPGLPADVVDMDKSVAENLTNLASAKGISIQELMVCVLDRPRHENLVAEIREVGARIILIQDGDVSGVISTAFPQTGVDAYMGIGGAPEGILAAAALACIGGQMQGRLVVRNEEHRHLAEAKGFFDHGRKYHLDEMAKGNLIFAATGVTDGLLLKGVRRTSTGAFTHSLVTRAKSGTVRFIEAWHHRRSGKTGLEI